jgi:two-component system response regulator FixJ
MTTPTVFIVDDDPSMRKSLRWLAESVGLRVETFGTAEEFLTAFDPQRPGCLVLDMRMPGMSGLDLQAELLKRGSTLPVVIVTGHGEVQSAVRAMKSGALAFIEKPFSDQELLDTVRHAIEVDADARTTALASREVEQRFQRLTPRERQVMHLIAAGRANKQIANELKISQKTVEVHRAHVMRKLEATSIAELVRIALALETRPVTLKLPPTEAAGLAPHVGAVQSSSL